MSDRPAKRGDAIEPDQYIIGIQIYDSFWVPEVVRMSETTGSPDKQQTPPDAGPSPVSSKTLAPTKFSDLVSYLQLLQTRTALTLALIALTVTASNSAVSFLPFLRPPPGSLPVNIYLAAFSLTLSAIKALGTFRLPPELRKMIFDRLRSSELISADYVHPKLQNAFVDELKWKQEALGTSAINLMLGLYLLILHPYMVFIISLIYAEQSLEIGNGFFAICFRFIFRFISEHFSVSYYSLFYTMLNIVLTCVCVIIFFRSSGVNFDRY